MDIGKVCSSLEAMVNALRVVEAAAELKAQSGRIRNILQPGELDGMQGNAVVALREANAALQVALKEDAE